MTKVSEARIAVWSYRVLMGTLNRKKESILFENLNRKQEHNQLEPLERRVWAAFKLYPNNPKARRTYLKRELIAWEKRTQS